MFEKRSWKLLDNDIKTCHDPTSYEQCFIDKELVLVVNKEDSTVEEKNEET